MSAFVQTMAAGAGIGLSRSLRTLESFGAQELAPGYNMAQWRNDPNVNRDIRQLFRQYATKAPLLDGAVDTLIERADLCEARFEGCEGKGLLAAYLLETLAISLPSDAAWDKPHLDIALTEVEEDGRMRHTECPILHASSPNHVREHATEFGSRRRDSCAGRNLVEDREQLLPRLRFCGDVEHILLGMGLNDPRLAWTRRCLFELNDCCDAWVEGQFPHEVLRGRSTRESPSVSANDELRRLRVFLCQDGGHRYFEWHLKHIGLNLRLHYLPMQDEGGERVVLVGYVGRHLPTASY